MVASPDMGRNRSFLEGWSERFHINLTSRGAPERRDAAITTPGDETSCASVDRNHSKPNKIINNNNMVKGIERLKA